ncbi:TPA: carbohydrate kinase [Escherichia coli]|nr:carbohydrate kinase [Escherichia coli]
MLGCCVQDIWGMTWKTTATLLLLVPVLQAPLARYAWIYRSILESVALMLKNNYDNMRNEMNHFAKHVIITAGGSNSDLFMQIFADMFNLPARRNAINGCASLGAAINKAVGLGLYPDYATAVDKMVRVKDIFIPIESNAKRYDAMNKGIFKDLTKHNDVILKKSYEVMHGELGNVDSIQSWSNA